LKELFFIVDSVKDEELIEKMANNIIDSDNKKFQIKKIGSFPVDPKNEKFIFSLVFLWLFPDGEGDPD
jgi:hypothetical protein